MPSENEKFPNPKDLTDLPPEVTFEDLSKYAAMIQAFDGFIYICSRDYKIEFMNQRLIERTGFNGVGQLCHKVLHDLDGVCSWCRNEQVFKGETVRWEIKSPKDNHWFYVVNTPIRHSDGTISKMALIQDITERKNVEFALRDSENRYRLLAESAQDVIYIVDSQLRLKYVNSITAKYLKTSQIDVVGRPIAEVFSKNTAEILRQRLKMVFESGQPRSFEDKLELSGEELWLDANFVPVKDPDGQITAVMSIARNITERKLTEEALKESQRTLYALLSNLPGVAYRCCNDVERTMEFVSNGCFELTGHQAQDLIQNSKVAYAQLIHPADREIVFNQIQSALAKKKPFRMVYRIKTSLGEEKWVWEQGRGIFSFEGKIVALEGFITNITDSKRSETRLARLRECFLSFSPDPDENINRLVAVCGGLLGATSSIYSRLEGDILVTTGAWHVPPDYKTADTAAGHICYDVIQHYSDEVLVLRNLQDTPYAKTDPNVSRYNLKTYIGRAVKLGNACMGALCGVYQNDYIPTEDDKGLITILALGIGVEERRKFAENELKNRIELRQIINSISTNFINLKIDDIDDQINKALREIGQYVGADRSYIFQLHDSGKKMDNTYEWCVEGVEPQISRLKGLATDNFAWFSAQMRKFENVHAKVSELPLEASMEKIIFQSQGIKSLVCVPMIFEGELAGFLGFDAVRQEKAWSEESITILKLLGEIFVNALERKRIDRSLRETQERYNRVIDGVSGYVYTVRIEDGKPVETIHGPACAIVTGYAPEEFTSDPMLWLKMVPEEDRAIVKDYAKDVLLAKTTQPIEHRIVRKDGLVRWIRNTPVLHFDKKSGLVSYDGLVQDVTERKLAEEALQQNERFMSEVFHSIQDGISILDTDLNVIKVNQVMEKWYDHAVPFIGKKCHEVYHGFKEPCKVCPSLQALKTGKPAYEVVPRTAKNGETIGWQDLYAFPMIDATTGKIKGVMEYVRDITERKLAEEELKKSEERYRGIIEDQTDFIIRWKSDGAISFVNDACARYLGKDQQDLIGKKYFSLLPAEDQEKLRQHMGTINRANPVATIEYRIIMPDGSLHWTQWTNRALFGPDGQVIEFQSVGRDITVHREMEDNQRQTERFLSNIFSSIQDGFSVLDNDLNIVRVNPTIERWFAHSKPLIGKKCYQAYHGEDKPCEGCPTRLTLATGQAACKVVPKHGKNKEVVGWVDLYSFPLLDKTTGKMTGVIEYARDITENKKAQEDLAVLNKELTRSNKRLKHLAMRDSHTGLYNHRYLIEVIEAEFARAKRYASPLSVLMLDIDYFKSINDVYGHPFGDLVLKQFARLLKRMLRRYDTVIRYGGEEFIILCPATQRRQAVVLAQRILDAINLYNFGTTQHVLKLKLSIAVSAFPEDKSAKGMDLVEVADRILNKVKESGGNRVYCALDSHQEKVINGNGKEKKESADIKYLKEKLHKLTKRANQSLIEAVFAFAKTIEVKDHYTGEHAERTVHYATSIASALQLSDEDIENIKEAATLHDLGKIGISERILLKKGPLTRVEFTELKKHPQIGADIIRPIQSLHAVIPLVLYHHERWDGKGYPNGLKGEEIPIGARVVSVADAYQALTSDRPYRRAYTKEKAMKIIQEESGIRYDPRVVNIFLKILQRSTLENPNIFP